MALFLDGILQIGSSEQLDTIETEVIEVERHLHNRERWLGDAGSDTTLTPITLTTGDSGFGAYVVASVAADQPYIAGNTLFDPHRVVTVTSSDHEPYRVRLAWGSGSGTAAVAAGDYTEFVTESQTLANQHAAGPIELATVRVSTGTTVWMACFADTNSATLGLFLGVHEYPD